MRTPPRDGLYVHTELHATGTALQGVSDGERQHTHQGGVLTTKAIDLMVEDRRVQRDQRCGLNAVAHFCCHQRLRLEVIVADDEERAGRQRDEDVGLEAGRAPDRTRQRAPEGLTSRERRAHSDTGLQLSPAESVVLPFGAYRCEQTVANHRDLVLREYVRHGVVARDGIEPDRRRAVRMVHVEADAAAQHHVLSCAPWPRMLYVDVDHVEVM